MIEGVVDLLAVFVQEGVFVVEPAAVGVRLEPVSGIDFVGLNRAVVLDCEVEVGEVGAVLVVGKVDLGVLAVILVPLPAGVFNRPGEFPPLVDCRTFVGFMNSFIFELL